MPDLQRAVLAGDAGELEAAVREIVEDVLGSGGDESATVYTAEEVDAIVAKIERRFGYYQSDAEARKLEERLAALEAKIAALA